MRPLAQDLWQLAPSHLQAFQAALVLGTAAIVLLNARALLQRFLDTALISWHQLKHGGLPGSGKKADKASISAVIMANCQVVLLVLGKAAVQVVAPAVLFLGLGLLLAFSLAHPQLMPDAAGVNALIDGATGFLVFWTGGTWFAMTSGCIWLFKTGTLRA